MKKIVTEIYFNEKSLPVFIVEGGTAFIGEYVTNGNAYCLAFNEVEHDPTPDVDIFETDGVNVQNAILVAKKVLIKNGFAEQTAHEASEALRPLFIRLEQVRHAHSK